MLVTGLPSAGKTTFAPNALHYDDVRRLPRDERLAAYAQANEVEGIFTTRASRAVLLDAWKGREGRRVCIWLDTPLETCIERERVRGRGELLARYHHRMFEPPTPDEGWDEIRIVRRQI
ncbi:MAG: hypothetical protein J6S63_00925 [Atopobiaceae bacterium]|nr:hypothetical protein [Atopobiaceae bacterium]